MRNLSEVGLSKRNDFNIVNNKHNRNNLLSLGNK